MSGVEEVRVGDVLRLERREVAIEPTREYSLVGVYSFGKGLFHREPVMGAELGDYRFFEIQAGDLVLSNIQAWEGAIGYATERDAGIVGTHRFLTYVPRGDEIRTDWARWFFLSEPGMRLIRRAAPGTAVRNRTLAIKRFEDLVIPLPSPHDQATIAARLDRAQDVTLRVAQRLALAQTWATGLRDALVTTDAVGRQSPWTEVALSDLMAQSRNQVDVRADGGYRIAGVYSFGRGLIDRGTIRGADTSYRTLTRLEADDVVISKLNGWEGAIAVVGEQFAGAHVSPEFPVFNIDRERLDPTFFRAVARSRAFWQRLDRVARGSMVRRRRISGEQFLAARVLIPAMATQVELARQIETLDLLSQRRGEVERLSAALVPAFLNECFSPTAQAGRDREPAITT